MSNQETHFFDNDMAALKTCPWCKKETFAPLARDPSSFVPCQHCDIDVDTGETLEVWKAQTQLTNILSPAFGEGKKFDSGKTQYHLMPLTALEQTNRVLMHGANKYGANNWQHVKGAEERYYNAALRHMFAWQAGEKADPESGINHLAHAICSLMFLIEKETT